MNTVTSPDGTKIAYDRAGAGPPIIFVTGAFNDRSTCAALVKLLEPKFTVITYDRRGRGDSGDTLPYAIDREAEDLEALITEVGPAYVFGYSSGARLALKATGVRKFALYEPPYEPQNTTLVQEIAALIAEGRRGDAVEAFQTKAVGLHADMVAQIRQSPYFPALEAMAHTLVYDLMLTTEQKIEPARVPALVLSGAETWPNLTETARIVAERTGGRHEIVPAGANHHIEPETVAPVLAGWFTQD
ncbi:pimeloyl-ACP methyl ester carboxylesterase [Kibdelosporangium banguiense]|uniref:Pimeloyl-ACP methyl ester carboxylesterase n=1 Tax=Kibdelosporangium banguiense TaxID=1365924 RepID=A0ABS4TGV4_9PSEU|nr:alpha/beta hydrolase [Kibdelosporangium banguiense]MBP2323078.1 pimeloyl-ACP methyl ester carboxylesterase [Kibdelosporangium banguiense]